AGVAAQVVVRAGVAAEWFADDGDDDVAGAQAGAVRGRAVDRRHYQQGVVGPAFGFHAYADVFAAGVVEPGFGFVLVQVGAVRVEVGQQAAQGGLHQLLVVHRFDVGVLDRVVNGHVTADFGQGHLGRQGFGHDRVGGVHGGGRRRLGEGQGGKQGETE